MIQDMEIALLCEHYHLPEMAGGFARKMGSVAEGKLPHCSETLASLFNMLAPCTKKTSPVASTCDSELTQVNVVRNATP
jgi:hypothetical protein